VDEIEFKVLDVKNEESEPGSVRSKA
jgi:hypothetical protein